MRYVILLHLLSLLLLPDTSVAQPSPSLAALDTPRPQYPSSSLLAASLLDQKRRSLLMQTFEENISPIDTKAVLEQLCPIELSKREVPNPSLAKAVTVTKSDFAVEFRFSYKGDPNKTHINSYSVHIDFSPQQVLLRHSSPRFKSHATGFLVPFARDVSRPIRLEGTLNSDMVAFVPPTRDCGVQGLMLCPRRYAHRDTLLLSPYELTDFRAIVNAKADGILSAEDNSPHKIMTSIQASKNIDLPPTWSHTKTGTKLIESSIELQGSTDAPFKPIHALPIQMAVQSKVDLGSLEKPLRSVSKTTTVEVSQVLIAERTNTRVGKSLVTIEGGTCYLVSSRVKEKL
jgi:hypothetical protein